MVFQVSDFSEVKQIYKKKKKKKRKQLSTFPENRVKLILESFYNSMILFFEAYIQVSLKPTYTS